MSKTEFKNFDDYLAQVTCAEFIAETAAQLQEAPDRVEHLVTTYANEARFGFSLIEPYLNPDQRLLEVGAGVGILSAYLHLAGYRVVAIEPSGTSFDLNGAIAQRLAQWLELENFCLLDLGVEDLSAADQGHFDLIYSVNVVEHLPDLDTAFARMQSVLSPAGLMIHNCPNYHVPYEPHFSIPLLPGVPSATRFLLAKSIATSDLWHSFNFVTSSRLKRIARQQRLIIRFETQTMYRSLRRLDEDPIFAQRHRGPVIWIYRFLAMTRLVELLRFWPASLSTPMTFFCQHKAST